MKYLREDDSGWPEKFYFGSFIAELAHQIRAEFYSMNSYWRARWSVSRKSRAGYQTLKGRLRSLTPFWLRHRLSNLLAGPARAERPLSELDFPAPQDYDIVCFPIIDWDLRFQRPQQLLTQFARAGHRVFYLHTTFHQTGPFPLIRNIVPNIYRVRLPGPPDSNLIFESKPGSRLLERWTEAIDQLRRQARIEKAISMVGWPNWGSLALACRQAMEWNIVYDCMDEHSGFACSLQNIPEVECELINGSDLVIATSHLLLEKVESVSGRSASALVPNGVDYEHFSKPGPARPLNGLARPVIGYYGAIAEWFDLEMIRRAAESQRDWQFVLIGDFDRADVSSINKLRNVHLPGELPYAVLPSYLHQFDIATIPFLITSMTRAINPVKFYEYLSAGKPVVSVSLPELEPYEDLFYPVRSASEFLMQTRAALKERSPEKAEARREFARSNTWEERHRQLSRLLESL